MVVSTALQTIRQRHCCVCAVSRACWLTNKQCVWPHRNSPYCTIQHAGVPMCISVCSTALYSPGGLALYSGAVPLRRPCSIGDVRCPARSHHHCTTQGSAAGWCQQALSKGVGVEWPWLQQWLLEMPKSQLEHCCPQMPPRHAAAMECDRAHSAHSPQHSSESRCLRGGVVRCNLSA